jgi:hypothetical protein
MVMLPGMLCGDYPEVKKKVAACVRRAVAPRDVVAALQGPQEIGPSDLARMSRSAG